LASPAVDTCSLGALAGAVEGERGPRDAVPGRWLAWCGGPHGSPGDFGMPSGSRGHGASLSPCPLGAKPITHGGLLCVTSIPECVRVPPPAHLCAAGGTGGCSLPALHARFTALRVSRRHGACASSWPQGERTCTSPASQLSKTEQSRPLIPGCNAISRERI